MHNTASNIYTKRPEKEQKKKLCYISGRKYLPILDHFARLVLGLHHLYLLHWKSLPSHTLTYRIRVKLPQTPIACGLRQLKRVWGETREFKRKGKGGGNLGTWLCSPPLWQSSLLAWDRKSQKRKKKGNYRNGKRWSFCAYDKKVKGGTAPSKWSGR